MSKLHRTTNKKIILRDDLKDDLGDDYMPQKICNKKVEGDIN
jgi:hypothetical protein